MTTALAPVSETRSKPEDTAFREHGHRTAAGGVHAALQPSTSPLRGARALHVPSDPQMGLAARSPARPLPMAVLIAARPSMAVQWHVATDSPASPAASSGSRGSLLLVARPALQVPREVAWLAEAMRSDGKAFQSGIGAKPIQAQQQPAPHLVAAGRLA
jgi:hypothetical protein